MGRARRLPKPLRVLIGIWLVVVIAKPFLRQYGFPVSLLSPSLGVAIGALSARELCRQTERQ